MVSMARGERRQRPARPRKVLKVVAASALALALVVGLSATFLYRHLNGNLRHEDVSGQLGTDRPPAVEVDGPDRPVNILVMGSDSRDCDGCGVDTATGGG